MDMKKLTKDASVGADIIDLMTKAWSVRIPAHHCFTTERAPDAEEALRLQGLSPRLQVEAYRLLDHMGHAVELNIRCKFHCTCDRDELIDYILDLCTGEPDYRQMGSVAHELNRAMVNHEREFERQTLTMRPSLLRDL
jgi:hypothetical protein